MSVKKEDILPFVDIALAALGVLPEVIAQVQSLFNLRSKIINGEEITQTDLEEVMAELRGRSKIIQAS